MRTQLRVWNLELRPRNPFAISITSHTNFFAVYGQLQAQVVPVLCYFLRNSYGSEEPKNTYSCGVLLLFCSTTFSQNRLYPINQSIKCERSK